MDKLSLHFLHYLTFQVSVQFISVFDRFYNITNDPFIIYVSMFVELGELIYGRCLSLSFVSVQWRML